MAPIPESEWEFVESHFVNFKYSKGDHLVRSGDDTEYIYFIESGLARTYFIDKQGTEFNKIFLAENDIASAYVELLNGTKARINIQALEDMNTYAFKFSKVDLLYKRHECWNELGRKIAENFFKVKEQREYEFLLLDAQERYEIFKSSYGHLMNRVPQYHISAYLGITPVSLSRIVRKIKSS